MTAVVHACIVSTLREVILKAWVIVTVADYPAAGACGPWVESASAIHPCRECTWMRKRSGVYDGVSSEDGDLSDDDDEEAEPRAPRTKRTGLYYLESTHQTHTWEHVCEILNEAQSLRRKSDRLRLLRENSMNKLVFAYHPDHIPGLLPTVSQPQDIMHLFLCGITRHELYLVCAHLVGLKVFSWEKLNCCIQALRLPKGKRIPKMYAAKVNKKKINEQHLEMTASEVLTFATYRCANACVCVRPTMMHEDESPPYQMWSQYSLD